MTRWQWLWSRPTSWSGFAVSMLLYVVTVAVAGRLFGRTWDHTLLVALVSGGIGIPVAALLFRRTLGSQVMELDRE